MKPPVLTIDLTAPSPGVVTRIAERLQEGSIVVYPTDTIYGVGCDALNELSVNRLKELKERDREKPLLVLIPDRSWATRLGDDLPPAFGQLAGGLWPGPLTIIVRAGKSVPETLCGAGRTIGMRWAKSLFVHSLLQAFGRPLVSTSANLSGQAPIRNPGVEKNSILDRADLVIDGGPLSGLESTVVDLSTDRPRLVREGALSRAALESALKQSLE